MRPGLAPPSIHPPVSASGQTAIRVRTVTAGTTTLLRFVQALALPDHHPRLFNRLRPIPPRLLRRVRSANRLWLILGQALLPHLHLLPRPPLAVRPASHPRHRSLPLPPHLRLPPRALLV